MFYPLGKNSEKPQRGGEGVASEFVSLIVKAFRYFEDFFQPLPTVRLTKGSSIVLDLKAKFKVLTVSE